MDHHGEFKRILTVFYEETRNIFLRSWIFLKTMCPLIWGLFLCDLHPQTGEEVYFNLRVESGIIDLSKQITRRTT
jgi:hypothetical protein